MANQLTATLNSIDNSGSIKARGFLTQDELVEYQNDEVNLGTFTELNVLWKGNSRSLLGHQTVKTFYRIIFGKLSKATIKDYRLNEQLVQDPPPPGFRQANKWALTFSSLNEFLNNPHWLIVYRES